MSEKRLGKINLAHYGMCGYQGAMLGLRIEIGGDGWGVGADKPGAWASEPDKNTKWTKEDQLKSLGENALFVGSLLRDAKVESVDRLVGVPVECIFDGMRLMGWRILKEVL